MIKRPLCVVGFSFSLAMAAAFFVSGGMALVLGVAVTLSGLGLRLWRVTAQKAILWVALYAMGAAFFGYSIYYQAQIAPFWRMAAREPTTAVTIEGLVSEVRVQTRSVRYVLEARFPNREAPNSRVVVYSFGESQAAVGDVVTLTAALEPAEGHYYTNNNIRATGLAQSPLVRKESRDFGWQRVRLRLRQLLRDRLYDNLPKETADVVGAMVFDVGEDLHPALYNHMNRSGISHMLSISGMHFSIITAFLLAILSRLRLPRRWPEALTILFGAVFVVITGFAPAIIRAFVMFLLVLLGQMSFRQGDSLNSLGGALLITCCIWPEWSRSLGLQLSAAATLGILLYGRRFSAVLAKKLPGKGRWLRRLKKGLTGAIGISGSAYLFTLPLLLYSNGWVSTYAIPTNVLVAPLATPVMLGGFLCALVPGQVAFMPVVSTLTEMGLGAILYTSKLVADFPFSAAAIDNGWKLIWLGGVMLIGGLLWYHRPGKKTAILAACLCVIAFQAGGISLQAANADKIELVTLADCRTAILLRGREAVLLGVPDRYQENNLLKYLNFRGVERISALIVPDSGDRVGSGIVRLHESYPIGMAAAPGDKYRGEVLARALKGVPVYPSQYATVQVLDKVLIRFAETGDILVQSGAWRLCKTTEPDNDEPGVIVVNGEGLLRLPEGRSAVIEPVGRRIFGETRVILPLRLGP